MSTIKSKQIKVRINRWSISPLISPLDQTDKSLEWLPSLALPDLEEQGAGPLGRMAGPVLQAPTQA